MERKTKDLELMRRKVVGGLGIPEGEDLSLIPPSHNSPCKILESYDDDDNTADDNDGDNGVQNPGVRDLYLFPPYVSGVRETPYGDDEDSNDDDDGVPIPRIRDLSFFPPLCFWREPGK